MSDDVIELNGSESQTGSIRMKLDIELPHDEAMAVLGIVQDYKAKQKKEAEAAARKAEQERKRAEAEARKAAKAEAAKAKKADVADKKAAAEDKKDGQAKS